MYSKARIAGHPIHPMLVSIPIGSFVLALLSSLIYLGSGSAFWIEASYWLSLSGIATGLFAALFGLIDWWVIPDHASAKTAANWHMILNVLNILLFAAGWWLLGGLAGPVGRDIGIPLALQALGVGVLLVTGWLGGEMVYRHHVAVEPVAPEEQALVDEYEHIRRRAA